MRFFLILRIKRTSSFASVYSATFKDNAIEFDCFKCPHSQYFDHKCPSWHLWDTPHLSEVYRRYSEYWFLQLWKTGVIGLQVELIDRTLIISFYNIAQSVIAFQRLCACFADEFARQEMKIRFIIPLNDFSFIDFLVILLITGLMS